MGHVTADNGNYEFKWQYVGSPKLCRSELCELEIYRSLSDYRIYNLIFLFHSIFYYLRTVKQDTSLYMFYLELLI